MQIDEVTVKVKVSLPQIDLVALKIGPFAAGSEVRMERWQAEVLGQWGIIERPRDSRTLLLQTYALRDKDQGTRSIEEMEDAFQVFPHIVRTLQAEGQLGQKIGALKALHEDLMSSRTNKITRIARMGQDPGEALSPEESWLYHSLRRIFDIWKGGTEGLLAEKGKGGE
jgi:hypothetical protein